jgi:AraC-like DNA-binding protein
MAVEPSELTAAARAADPAAPGVDAAALPLGERIEFAKAHVADAEAFIDRHFGARFVNRSGDVPYLLRLCLADAGLFTSSEAHLPGDVVFHVQSREHLHINTVIDGRVEAHRDGRVDRYGRGDVYLARFPGADYRCDTHDVRSRSIGIPFAAIAEAAGEAFGGRARQPRFASVEPARAARRRWHAAIGFVDNVIAEPRVGDAPLVLGATARLLAATALSVFPNDAVVPPNGRDGSDARTPTVKRAVAYIEANPHLDIGISDIARAAYVTPRAVQLAFRRQLDTTPTGYLRRVRLDCAHEQLRGADPTALTVTDVALRWGFPNAGRFAEYYRAAYGEVPSQTLRG